MTSQKYRHRITLAIPKDREGVYRHIANACDYEGVEFQLYDIYSCNWIDEIRTLNPDGCIYSGEFRFASWRDLFRERIRFLNEQLGIPLYPRLHEYDLWESKRKMSYWLKANHVPHAETWVFGDKEEAYHFILEAEYPIVFKTDFGNASFGVRILKNRKQALAIWSKSFGNGFRIPTYNSASLDLRNRIKAIVRPAYRSITGIRDIPRDVEVDIMLLQKAIDIKNEWRVIKSGDCYFGHQKLPSLKGMRSGSSLVGWVVPPIELFEFVKVICEKGDFSTMCVDVFEDSKGQYYVNELQTIFGVIAPNQMYKKVRDKLVGIKICFDRTANTWTEEEGEFGQDYHYRTRLKTFVAILNNAG